MHMLRGWGNKGKRRESGAQGCKGGKGCAGGGVVGVGSRHRDDRESDRQDQGARYREERAGVNMLDSPHQLPLTLTALPLLPAPLACYCFSYHLPHLHSTCPLVPLAPLQWWGEYIQDNLPIRLYTWKMVTIFKFSHV